MDCCRRTESLPVRILWQPYRLPLGSPFSQKKLFNTSLMTVRSSDQTQLTQVLGRRLRQDIYWGSWSLLTQWWAHRGCNSPPRLSSDDHSLLKAPGTLLPTSISFPGSVVKFVWLHLILKNLRNDRRETEIVFHVRYISSEQRIKWTLYQWRKHFFCLLWVLFPNNLLVEVN